MRRNVSVPGVVFVLAADGLSGRSAAQTAPHPLHRPIPGDLPLSETEQRRDVTPPLRADQVMSSAGIPSNQADPGTDGAISRPRDAWETPVREMDRNTQSPPGARLAYEEVFTPSVTPFKRTQAYDAVDEGGRLTVRDPSLVAMDVSEESTLPWAGESHARFVGELNLEIAPGRATPIPGVAGDQRVVSYSTSTGQPLEFVHDSAGNLFVRGTQPETLRLTFVLEAPEHAFEVAQLRSESLDRAGQGAAPGDRPAVPAWLLASVLPTLQAAGTSREDRFEVVLSRLVGYFRSFTDAALPTSAPGTNVYGDLALGRVGACRHRAYAFVLTLQGIGIPARYVGNEAHAWAEVWLDGSGWARIDLGGWDIPLDAQAPSERPQFHPARRDIFPRPEHYEEQYSAAAARSATTVSGSGTGTGTSAGGGGAGGSGASPEDGRNSGGTGSGPEHAAGGTSSAGGGGGGGGVGGTGASGTSIAGGGTGRGGTAGRPGVGPGAEDETTPTVLLIGSVRSDETAGFASGDGFVRGSMLHVEGEVRDDHGVGVASLPVEVQLLHNHRVVQVLGTTVSQGDGHWDVRVQIPASIDPGDYGLRFATDGNVHHAAAAVE